MVMALMEDQTSHNKSVFTFWLTLLPKPFYLWWLYGSSCGL